MDLLQDFMSRERDERSLWCVKAMLNDGRHNTVLLDYSSNIFGLNPRGKLSLLHEYIS